MNNSELYVKELIENQKMINIKYDEVVNNLENRIKIYEDICNISQKLTDKYEERIMYLTTLLNNNNIKF